MRSVWTLPLVWNTVCQTCLLCKLTRRRPPRVDILRLDGACTWSQPLQRRSADRIEADAYAGARFRPRIVPNLARTLKRSSPSKGAKRAPSRCTSARRASGRPPRCGRTPRGPLLPPGAPHSHSTCSHPPPALDCALALGGWSSGSSLATLRPRRHHPPDIRRTIELLDVAGG